MTLAIGHKQDDVIILDALRERRPPFSAQDVCAEFSELCKSYRISKIIGDKFGGIWPAERFREHGITYEAAAKPKADYYRDFVPVITSKKIDLLDDPRLIAQLCGLERRTALSGRDSMGAPPGGHDDVSDVVAGVASIITGKKYNYDDSLDWVSGPTDADSAKQQEQIFQNARYAQHVMQHMVQPGRAYWRRRLYNY